MSLCFYCSKFTIIFKVIMILTQINNDFDSNQLSPTFHKYFQTSLISGDLFLTFNLNGHE